MTDAYRDQNNVPTIIGVSSVDGKTPVRWKIDPVTGRGLVENATDTGTSSPSSTPTYVGQMYVNTNAKKIYIATGTTNSSDWTILN